MLLAQQRLQRREPHRELASFVLNNLLLKDVDSRFELFEGEQVRFVGLLGMASHGFIDACHYFLVQLPAPLHTPSSLQSTTVVLHITPCLHAPRRNAALSVLLLWLT